MVGMRMVLAIIIIIVIATLVVLVFLGDLPQSSPNKLSNAATNCLPSTGIICNNISYSSSTGNINLDMGQDTGSNWTNVYAVFVSNNYTNYNSNGNPVSIQNGTNMTYVGNIPSSENGTTIILKSMPHQTLEEGTIWVSYTFAGNTTTYYEWIASLTINVTK